MSKQILTKDDIRLFRQDFPGEATVEIKMPLGWVLSGSGEVRWATYPDFDGQLSVFVNIYNPRKS